MAKEKHNPTAKRDSIAAPKKQAETRDPAVEHDPAVERGERIQTGKSIARGGGKKGFVPGATEQPQQ